MSKYSIELKLQIVKYCLEGKHSFGDAAKYFGIPSRETIRRWYKKYELYGLEGISKNKNTIYSGEFKQNVIEYMYENHLSASETSIIFNLSSENVVLKWANIYNEKGPQALISSKCGRSKNMSSKPKRKNINQEKEALIAENEYLRMENEYLKKLNALVQERIKQENKKK